MKILKFGGSSVATPESILKVKDIVSSRSEPPVVVVSALGGVTDQLIRASCLAEKGDGAFRDELAALRERHHALCRAVVDDVPRQNSLLGELDALIDQLYRICEGVSLLQVLPPKTANEVMSFGERLSARIVTAVLPGAALYDAIGFIRTRRHGNRDTVDQGLTYDLIQDSFRDWP